MPSETSINGKRILVVEDDADTQNFIKLILGREGCRVEVAGNGRAGLDRLEGGEFDLLILDDQMPIMDGYEALTTIRAGKRWAKLPILMCGGWANEAYFARTKSAGVDDHLVKPFSANALRDAAYKLLTDGRPRDG